MAVRRPAGNEGGAAGAGYRRALRRFSRDTWLFLATNAIFGFSIFGGIYTVLSNLYLLRLGYGPEFVGLANSVGLVSFAAFSLVAGLGGRADARRSMIWGLAFGTASFGLYPAVELLPEPAREAWLLGCVTLGGLAIALYLVNGNPYLTAATGPEERGHAFSVRGALIPLAGVAGAVVGGLLPRLFALASGASTDEPAPYRWALLLAAVLLVPATLLLAATRPTRAAEASKRGAGAQSRSAWRAAPWAILGIMLLTASTRGAGVGAVRTFLNVYLDELLRLPTEQIGLLLGLGQLAAVPATLATPLVIRRCGQRRAYALLSVANAGALLPLALIPHWAAAAAGFTIGRAFSSMADTALVVFQMAVVTPRYRAMISGLSLTAGGLSWGLMAGVSGYLVAGAGYAWLFLTAAACLALSAAVFSAYFRRPRGELSPAPAVDPAR